MKLIGILLILNSIVLATWWIATHATPTKSVKGHKPDPHPQRFSKRTRTSLILLASVAFIVLLDLIGPIFLSSGRSVISGHLHDTLQMLAILSVPLVFLLLAIGFVLGTVEWRIACKASRRPNRATVVATLLNLFVFLLGILLIFACLRWMTGPEMGLWPG